MSPTTNHGNTIDEICNAVVTYYPEVPKAEIEMLRFADKYSEKVHGSQKRHSGEPYMMHPRAVAMILTELHLDVPSIAAAILHDTVEDTHATLEDVEKNFGAIVAQLVDGVTKLSKITFKTSEEKQAENFRKMIMAMARDIRVILIKLADRLHNMRTLEHLLPYKQKLIAQETLDVYAPIANRLGISSMKTELEDLCLRYLHPDIYYKLTNKVSKSKRDREKYIEDVTNMILDQLKEYDLNGSVTGRPKHFFSIYKKMERRKIDFDQIHDLIAFRILLDNITECYKALGVIHATYKPVPGRFKDYIAMPKANQYQSLHTTVIGPHGERVEIQIRTHEMNAVAENGIAAHWKYKEGKFDSNAKDVEWVNRLVQWHKDLKDPNEFLETVKIDLFAEDVYVFTPHGDVMEFPFGATPLDFAYAVHSDVGNHCMGAKVNGKIVPLKYRLKSGDTMEIITSPTQVPNKDWLKLVKTSKAKSRIRNFIKTQERTRAGELGKDMLEKELKNYSQKLSTVSKLKKFNEYLNEKHFKTVDDLTIYIGYGRLSPVAVVQAILSDEMLAAKKAEVAAAKEPSFLEKVFESAKKKTDAKNAISVGSLDNILIRFGRCCTPIPGDAIVGFVTRGRGVTVHTTNCTKALDLENERRVDVHWNTTSPTKRHVKIRVLSHDMPGILADMSQAIAGCGVNISQANIRTTKDRKAISMFEVEVTSTEQLAKVLSSLESKKAVINVERVKA